MPFPFYFFTLRFKILQKTQFLNTFTYIHTHTQNDAVKLVMSSKESQKYLESFEMWCWRRMEKISWTDHVRNEEMLL